jgi:hypothetical protein
LLQYRHNLHACSNAVYGMLCIVNYYTGKGSILSFLLLLFVLNSLLDTFDKGLNGLAAAQRHGTTSDGTTVLDLEAQSFSDHGKTTISQCDCEAAQTLLQLRRVEDAFDDVLFLLRAQRFYGALSCSGGRA